MSAFSREVDVRVLTSVYRWRARDELSPASYWTGDVAKAAALARELLDGGELPDNERNRVTANLILFEQPDGACYCLVSKKGAAERGPLRGLLAGVALRSTRGRCE